MNPDKSLILHKFYYIRDFLGQMYLIVDDVKFEVKEQYRKHYMRLRAGITDKSSYQKKMDFIEALEMELSKDIIDITQNHSTLFWMQYFRKLDFSNMGISFSRASTASLVLDTIDCFVMKYGSKEKSDVISIGIEMIPLYDKYKDTRMILKLYYFCVLFNSLQAAKWRLSKGCKMVFEENEFSMPANEELEQLMDLYDTRCENYGSLLHDIYDTCYSTSNVIEMVECIEKKLESRSVFPLIISAGSFFLRDNAIKKITAYPYNYVPRCLFIEGTTTTINYWETMNIRIRSHSPSEIISFLAAIAWIGYRWDKDSMELASWSGLLINGFSIVRYSDEYLEDIEEIFSEIYPLISGHSMPRETIDSLIRSLFQEFSDCEAIDPSRKENIPVYIRYGEWMIVNWYNIEKCLLHWTDGLNTSQRRQVGAIRGACFQEEVRRVLQSGCGDSQFVVWPQKSECLYVGGKEVCEVDICVKKGNALYVIECKHNLSSSQYRSGTREGVKYFNRLARKWLESVDNTARLVTEGAALKDGTVLCNNEIEYVVPLVCTPIPIYTERAERYYFATDHVPRVLTPRELLDVINQPIESIVNCYHKE